MAYMKKKCTCRTSLINNNNNNLTNSYWSIGSTMNVKEDRAQTREMVGMETQFQCGHYNNFNGVLQNI